MIDAATASNKAIQKILSSDEFISVQDKILSAAEDGKFEVNVGDVSEEIARVLKADNFSLSCVGSDSDDVLVEW